MESAFGQSAAEHADNPKLPRPALRHQKNRSQTKTRRKNNRQSTLQERLRRSQVITEFWLKLLSYITYFFVRGRHLVTQVTLDQVLEEVALMRKDLKSIEKSHDYLLESLELRKKPAKS